MPPQLVDDLEIGIRKRSRAALGRAITLIESKRTDHRRLAEELVSRIMPLTGNSHRIGISGIPGAGKSTFIEGIGMDAIEEGHRVAVLAIDPSSMRTGGSILGDKTRMLKLSTHPQAFVRPSPTSGTLGGVARRTRESLLLCEAFGFDRIFIETVGVGQSETSVAQMCDVFVLLAIAGAGDELQGIKRGILEMADIIAINKADGANLKSAERAAAELRSALRMINQKSYEDFGTLVCTTSSLSPETRLPLRKEIDAWLQRMTHDGKLVARRAAQRDAWLWEEIRDLALERILQSAHFESAFQSARKAVNSHLSTPSQCARNLVELCLRENS